MSILSYAGFAYGLTIVLSYLMIGIVVATDKYFSAKEKKRKAAERAAKKAAKEAAAREAAKAKEE